jgi:hypothetical protein
MRISVNLKQPGEKMRIVRFPIPWQFAAHGQYIFAEGNGFDGAVEALGMTLFMEYGIATEFFRETERIELFDNNGNSLGSDFIEKYYLKKIES